jgi:hypothetical protein
MLDSIWAGCELYLYHMLPLRTPASSPSPTPILDSATGGEHRGLSRWKHAHVFDIEVDGLNAEKLLREQYPEEVKN